MKQKIAFYITGGLLAMPLFAVVFTTQPTLAYKCTGQTSNQQHYYKDGACYQPVGNTCLDNPAPSSGEECQNRDTSKDTKVADEQPVKNDGSEIEDWECASGTYNATKKVCETCTSFGGCQTNARVSPTPKGQDTTTDPDTEDPDGTSGSENKSTKGECAGEKTDFLACDADGSDAIIEVLKLIILFASVGVGVVAVGGIVYGAILYASAQDSQDQIRKAVVIIRGVLIGLVLYMFMVAILNFLVPGGVFGGATEDPQSSETNGSNQNNSNGSNNTGNNNNTNNNNQNQNN